MARHVLALAGRCLVAATLVESWLPWWTTSSGNLTETNPSYSGVPPPSGASKEPTASQTTPVWWSEWNFKVLFGWTNYAVFSTPERKGSLGTDGGWALYFVDKLGVLCFGQYWPVAGWTALAALLTLLVTALARSFRACALSRITAIGATGVGWLLHISAHW